MEELNQEEPIHVDGCSCVKIEILPPTFSTLHMQVACRRVRIAHPLQHLLALALVVSTALMELLVDCTQELVKVSRHALP